MIRLPRSLLLVGVAALVAIACAGCQGRPATVQSYTDEDGYVAIYSPVGPLNAPYTRNIPMTVGKDDFTIEPGVGASGITVGNIIDSLPSDLHVQGVSYSNLEFKFPRRVRGFGFVIESATGQGYVGESEFVATLKRGDTTVGVAPFTAPADGPIFAGFVSSVDFDTISLAETQGGPQNQNIWSQGCVDRESFGQFYVVED